MAAVEEHDRSLCSLPRKSKNFSYRLRSLTACRTVCWSLSRAMATIPEIKVHFSIQHPDIPSYLAKAFSIIVRCSRPPREAKSGYNPDPRLLDYRFVNARNGESSPSDSKGLAEARARGFSEHPQRPRMAPASAPPEVYLQYRNRCHGPKSAGTSPRVTTRWWCSTAPAGTSQGTS
jgi:hypothetical protein